MYCYDKTYPHKQTDFPLSIKKAPNCNPTVQMMESIKNHRRLVPPFTNIIHCQTPHKGYPSDKVEEIVKDRIGWSIPYSPDWGRFYIFMPITRHVISFSVTTDTATVHHAGPFGGETTAQL